MANGRRGPEEERLDLFDKVPPQNIEAECGVLGSIFLDNTVLPKVRDAISGPDDFYRDAHQILYRVILGLADQGKPINALTMADELTRLGLFRDIGGEDYLCDIIGGVPHAANAKHYAGIVRQKSVARGLIEVFDDGMRRATRTSSPPSSSSSMPASRSFASRVSTRIGKIPAPKGRPHRRRSRSTSCRSRCRI